MKKIYMLGCMLLLQLSSNLSAQVILSEDFSSASGTTPPAGWTNNDIASSGEIWYFNNPAGRLLDNPITDPAAIFDSDYNGWDSYAEDAALETPVFDVSTSTGYILLSFDHFLDASYDGLAIIEVFDGTSWVEVWQSIVSTDAPEHLDINITTELSGSANAQVRFRWIGDYAMFWIVDNVKIEEVTCLPVSNIDVTGISPNSIDISWSPGDAETNWNIEYGPQGFTPGTGIAGTSSTGTFSAGSLTASSYYDFYVQADCGAGDVSNWTGPLTVYTGYCEFEGVDSDFFIDNFSTTGGTVSNISNLGSGYGTNGYEDATSMIVSSFAGGPDINFTVDNGYQYYLGLGIWVDWNNDMMFDSGEQVYASGYYDETYSGSFSVPAGTPVGTYRMRVMADADNSYPEDACSTLFGYGEAEDYTLEVTATPTCLPIVDLVTDGFTENTIDISWTPLGTETDWNIEYGPQGFTPGTGTLATVSGTPEFTATLLTPFTHYDFYVQADCGGGDESTWSGPLTGFTGYCEIESTQTDYYINNFKTTGGATSNISNLNSGLGTNAYEDATSMVVSQFEGGPNVNFTVNFGFEDWYTFGFGIWVDWNDNMIFESTEQVFQSFSYEDNFTGSFNVPAGVAVGSYRMRIMADYWNDSPDDACTVENGEVEDYTFEVIPIPSCLPVSDLEIDAETTASLDISWTPGDTETTWNIEWGVPGFVPGTGNGIDSAQQTSSASFTVSGLTSATNYDVYVQALCSSTDSSYWTLVNGTTLCAPITAIPWTEDFESMNDFGGNIFPTCWASEYGEWGSDNGSDTPGWANSGTNFLGIYYGSDDYLWTPEFELVAGSNYEFNFKWASVDDYEGWSGSVLVNTSQSSVGAETLGIFIESDEAPEMDYKKSSFCFTPTTSGVYTFGVHVSASFSPWFLAFDDFNVIEHAGSAGTGGTLDICQIEGLVDLNSIVTITDTMGNWTFASAPAAIVNDTMFNPELSASGIVSVDYITYGCLVDTVSALIHVYPASNAGADTSILVCKNQPIDLYDALGNGIDLGGDWYDPSNSLIASSTVTTASFPGSYNYRYIGGNDICPNDTSEVVVVVLSSCDWLSVDEQLLESVNLYPNPSTGMVYIESGLDTKSLTLEVTDVNGRIVETTSSITNGVTGVDLSHVQRGTYFFKLVHENAEKVYRVVIQ